MKNYNGCGRSPVALAFCVISAIGYHGLAGADELADSGTGNPAVATPQANGQQKPSSRSTADQASPTASSQQELGEVVVTALRRTERLQDVPAAVTALSAQELNEMGASSYQDYLNTVPSVSFGDNGRRTRIVIRGISSDVLADPPVGATTGVYIDDAPVTELEASTFDPSIFDVDRVEILRGPQGTLYGSSAMGGTVRVILNQPKLDEVEGIVQTSDGSVDHGGINYSVEGVTNLPLVDNFAALRVSVGDRSNAGFIDNVANGTDDINSRDRKNARAALLIQPADKTSIVLNVMYQKDKWNGLNYADPAIGAYETSVNTQEAGGSESRLYGLTVKSNLDWANFISATNYLSKNSTEFIDATSFVGPFLTFFTGIPVLPTQGVGFAGITGYDTFTQEFRLASSGSQKLQWLAGAFYSHSRSSFEQYIPTFTIPQYSSYGSRGLYDVHELTSRTQVAGFGELAYNFTDRFSLTAGARIADLSAQYSTVNSGLLAAGSASDIYKTSSDPLTKKFLASFKATSDNLLYAQAAQGFREGSAEVPVPISRCGADLHTFGLSTSPTSYAPDTLWSYEIGSKNTLFGKQLTLDGAVYYIDWPNRQQAITLPTCQDSIILNAGKAVSKGVELESSYRPLSDFNVNASMSYTNSRITSFPQIPIFTDNRLPLSPDWQWDINAQYNFHVTDQWQLFVRSDISHVGSRWNILEGEGGTASLMDAYTLGSARLGLVTRHWETDLFVTNLTDTRAVVNRDINGNGINNSDLLAEPRVIGVSVKLMY